MGIENWTLKGTELVTNTKKQRLKIWSRGQTLKNTILKKQTKIAKVRLKNMKFGFKNRVFFSRKQQVLSMKIKGVIEDFKKRKKKFK